MGAVEVQPGLFVRGFTPPLRLGDFKLVAFDMDSTLINIESVDEIAAAAGRKAEVAAITEAAMRGEISDYQSSLRQRLALLRGVPVSALEAVYSQHLQLSWCHAPGARSLTVRKSGACCWRWPSSWASRPNRPSPWVTAPTTCR